MIEKADTESIIEEWKLKKRADVLNVKHELLQTVEEASREILATFDRIE